MWYADGSEPMFLQRGKVTEFVCEGGVSVCGWFAAVEGWWPTPKWGSQWECNTAAELNIQVHCHVAGDICGGSSPSPSPSPAPPAPTPPSYYWSSVAVHGVFVVHLFSSFYCTHLVFWPLHGACGLFMVSLMWVMAASRAPTIVS